MTDYTMQRQILKVEKARNLQGYSVFSATFSQDALENFSSFPAAGRGRGYPVNHKILCFYSQTFRRRKNGPVLAGIPTENGKNGKNGVQKKKNWSSEQNFAPFFDRQKGKTGGEISPFPLDRNTIS